MEAGIISVVVMAVILIFTIVVFLFNKDGRFFQTVIIAALSLLLAVVIIEASIFISERLNIIAELLQK